VKNPGQRLFPARICLYRETERTTWEPSLCRDDGDESVGHTTRERDLVCKKALHWIAQGKILGDKREKKM